MKRNGYLTRIITWILVAMLLLSSLSGLLVTFAHAAGGLSIGMSKTNFSTSATDTSVVFTITNTGKDLIKGSLLFTVTDTEGNTVDNVIFSSTAAEEIEAGQSKDFTTNISIGSMVASGTYIVHVYLINDTYPNGMDIGIKRFTIKNSELDEEDSIKFTKFQFYKSAKRTEENEIDRIRPGQTFYLYLEYELNNTSNATVSLDNQNFWFTDKDFSLPLSKDTSFKITASPSLPAGVAMIEITVKYTENSTGKTVTTTVSVPINVYIPEQTSDPEEPEIPDSILKPYIFIDKFSYGGALVPGNDIPLYFRMVNLSSSAALQNIMVSLAPSGAVALKGTTDKIYIKEMATGGVVEKSLTLSSMDTIDSTSVQVTLEFTYEYFLNDAYQTGSCTQTLNIPVVKIGAGTGEVKDRFEISSVTPPEQLIAGEEGYATVIVINKGKEAAGNVSVTVLGDNLSNNGYTEYYGAVAPNSKAEIEIPITPATSGDIAFKLLVSYEDTQENVKEQEKEMTITALSYEELNPDYPVVDPDLPVDPIPPEETGLSPLMIGLIAAGSLIVVLIVVVIVVKRVKAKRNEVEDEDL